MHNYAYKKPDGTGIFKVVLNQPLEDNTKTIQEAGLWPVDTMIPAGKVQDFTAGTQGWFVDGDTVRPCLMDEPPPFVPMRIPMYKLRLWLIAKSMLDSVNSIINNPTAWPSEQAHAEAVTRWEYIDGADRNSDMVNNLGAALGLSPAAIDTAFIEASQIV